MKEEDIKNNLIEANTNIARFVAQWGIEQSKKKSRLHISASRLTNRGDAILRPAFFWAETLDGENSPLSAVELGIKLGAAKLKVGDISFVYESGIGQIAWLSARAVELQEDANRLDMGSRERARLIALALKAQSLAAKLMLSLGALANFGAGDSGNIRSGD